MTNDGHVGRRQPGHDGLVKVHPIIDVVYDAHQELFLNEVAIAVNRRPILKVDNLKTNKQTNKTTDKYGYTALSLFTHFGSYWNVFSITVRLYLQPVSSRSLFKCSYQNFIFS